MSFTETGKEKIKREAYEKANKERGVRKEAERDYKMFGTTEQNIPNVDTMGNVTGMKKGGKVMKKMKRYEGGGDIESTQGENKAITNDVRARAMAAIAAGGQKDEEVAPKKSTSKSQPESDREEHSPWMRDMRKQEAENQRESQALFNKKPVDTTSKEDPAKVAKAYQAAAKMQASKPRGMKSGGSVKSASARADGCAIRGKTRA
jgi:hypothetical protein